MNNIYLYPHSYIVMLQNLGQPSALRFAPDFGGSKRNIFYMSHIHRSHNHITKSGQPSALHFVPDFGGLLGFFVHITYS